MKLPRPLTRNGLRLFDAERRLNLAQRFNAGIKRTFVIALGLSIASCATMNPPDTGGPRNLGPNYPIVFTELTQRTDASFVALDRLTHTDVVESGVHLQPITAVIKNLPSNLSVPLFLPKVGVDPEMNEEETRESLRRLLTEWRDLIGAKPEHLSLVERIERPDGVKIARYEQRPFRFPLRGDYGQLEVQFLANRSLRNLTSTCIPDSERIQPSLAQTVPKLIAEDAIKKARESEIVYTDENGQQVKYRIPANEEVTAVELVTYVFPTTGRTDALELHIAWELSSGTAPRRLIYVDAVDGTTLGGTLASKVPSASQP